MIAPLRLFIVIIPLVLLWFDAPHAQTYERTRKNWIFDAEAGFNYASTGFFKGYSQENGLSIGASAGRYIATRRTGVLPVALKLRYTYVSQAFSIPDSLPTRNMHQITVPIQADFPLFSFPLGKSRHHECMWLLNIAKVSIMPGVAILPESTRFVMPVELAYAFNISRSGGHRTVMRKNLHYAIFARTDLFNRFPANGTYPATRNNVIGLRIQYTWFKVYQFSNM
jgi:hypothetical protein